MEKAQYQDENIADVKASQQLAKLYDEILKENQPSNSEEVHALNLFLTRLLFCYFAEDTNIFEENQFTNAIESHTQTDGSDVDVYLARIFKLFNTPNRDASLPEYLKSFPYVNGGLFSSSSPVPVFNRKSRAILIEIGNLNWSEINPDIFGSMIQAVITPEHRGNMGMHYTSVPNIMKVIQPLFLDELYEEFDKVKTNKRKLQTLIVRISNLKLFDPACGSGNFLIIAYKELRILEMKILQQIDILARQKSFVFSEMRLSQFYGIELDDFAKEVAILSLWLAEHQMNLEFFKEFGRTAPSLPLSNGGNIVHGNATRLDWEVVCPKEEDDEIYILGNPPYLGSSMQDKEQKEDKAFVFEGIKNYKNLDYIACWFYKGAKYIQKFNAKYAFVTTNSINQGEQVAMLWSHFSELNTEIFFAYPSFKWVNNAKSNANVIVAIIGLRNVSNKAKYLYQSNIKHKVNNINAYLLNASNVLIKKQTKPISSLSIMEYGNKAVYGEPLILSTQEKDELLLANSLSEQFIRPLLGAREFLNGLDRWVLWIEDNTFDIAMKIQRISERIEKVKNLRLSSKDKGANELANFPYRFRDTKTTTTSSIIIPLTSSERRAYIPIGFLSKEHIITNAGSAIYDAEPWLFSVITSKMHMTWMRTVAGRLKTDYRYSSALVYNTFPFPPITKKQKELLTEHTFNVLDAREQHSEKTLAQLYDPNKMPQNLKDAHQQLDLAVEQCYRSKPFESDEERLEFLFGLYEKMVGSEKKKK
jgi:type II restriction/modification system DNA methylase subunit YeeA